MGALRDFVADLMEGEGAAIEPVEPDGLDVLAPEPLRAAMGWPELVRLGFGAQLPLGAMPIGLEGDWLDRFAALLGDRGRLAERELVLPAANPAPSDSLRRLDGALDVRNAVWRLRSGKPGWTRCLLLAFRFTAVSDEQREGLIWLGLNQGTGAVLTDAIVERLRELLRHNVEWRVPEPDTRREADAVGDALALGERVRPLLEHHVRHELEPFLRAVRRRLDRDRDRVHEYHDKLRQTAQARLAALRGVPGDKAEAHRRREASRVAAIEREYAAKIEDLRHNYALRVRIDWVQGLILYAPVQRYEVLIKRRKGERVVAIDWHAAARLMEMPLCEWGLGLERTRLVCDDHLHLTEVSGQDHCKICGKAWCRACHGTACPRCRRAAAASAACALPPSVQGFQPQRGGPVRASNTKGQERAPRAITAATSRVLLPQ
jgi:hypothetical protein